MENPKLRPIEVLPVNQDGETMYLLNDPTGVGDSLMLSPLGAQLAVQFFNGAYSLQQVQDAVAAASGFNCPLEEIMKLAHGLDQAGLLASETYQARLSALQDAYLDSQVRTATHAGGAYPEDPDKCRSYLDEIMALARGKGAAPVPGMRGLIAPHIDFMRGAKGYAHAYSAFEETPPAGTVIILGVGHQVSDAAFLLTEKDFDTPLGTVKTDRALLSQLIKRCGDDILMGQYQHGQEHSIEFQALMLRHLFGDDVTILPVLCGAFPQPNEEAQDPMDDARVRGFIEALAEEIDRLGDDCLVVAGVDFAHVGPRFGDASPVDKKFLKAVEVSDRYLLEAICEGEADLFFSRLSETGNQYSVCGYAALYTLLKAMPGLSGELRHYGQAAQPEGDQAVTFAAVACR